MTDDYFDGDYNWEDYHRDTFQSIHNDLEDLREHVYTDDGLEMLDDLQQDIEVILND